MLRTRHREKRLLELCFELEQPCVIDNTNPETADRARYLGPAREAGFRTLGFYFESKISGALARNELRDGVAKVPEKGILGTYGRLELPNYDEGFDELSFVRIGQDGFEVSPWESSDKK